MKKRAFLAPLAAVVGVLFGASGANANVSSASPERVIEGPKMPTALKGAFVIERSVPTGPQMTYHRSHVSHASHASHASHVSHYSGY